jgi:Fis family transcriptional regulator, factor for inversion stimulation protein
MNSIKKTISTNIETERRQNPLGACVHTALELYFKDLGGHRPKNVYQMVLSEVEHPLLKVVLQYARGNQSKAAEILGINRSTLRKKLAKYGLSD